TPTPTITPTPTRGFLPPPTGLTGRLSAWGGEGDARRPGYLPLGYFDLQNNLNFLRVGDRLARFVNFSPNGQRLLYGRASLDQPGSVLESSNLTGGEQDALVLLWQDTDTVLFNEMPSYGPTGNQLTFVAVPSAVGTITNEVYTLALAGTDGGSPLRQVTNDGDANFEFPQISPDGSRIVAVRTSALDNSTDLVVIDIASGTQTPLTTDLTTFTETTPRWTRDASQIYYAAAPANAPENRDIFIRPATGVGTPQTLVADPADDSFPVVSPDGRHLAFSSDRGGAGYEIYIMEIQTGALSQLTNNEFDDFAGSWVP
ncbi:MAG: hypothetical protein GYB67_01700, partial [Chloroflexi bacterium]|nr:hypothetical protein [Chloroflexota bacterium]